MKRRDFLKAIPVVVGVALLPAPECMYGLQLEVACQAWLTNALRRREVSKSRSGMRTCGRRAKEEIAQVGAICPKPKLRA